MEDKNYVALGPDDVVREGDEVLKHHNMDWVLVDHWHFGKCDAWSSFIFRRPRSTLIRDAAIEVLRWHYIGRGRANAFLFEDACPAIKNLREAIGLSLDDLLIGAKDG